MDINDFNSLAADLGVDERFLAFCSEKQAFGAATGVSDTEVTAAYRKLGLPIRHEKRNRILRYIEEYGSFGIGLTVHLDEFDDGGLGVQILPLQPHRDDGSLVSTSNGRMVGTYIGSLAKGALASRVGREHVPKDFPKLRFSTRAELEEAIRFSIELFFLIKTPVLERLRQEHGDSNSPTEPTSTVKADANEDTETFVAERIDGAKALDTLAAYRNDYLKTGNFPFLIGESRDLKLINEVYSSEDRSFDELIKSSLTIDPQEWINQQRANAEASHFTAGSTLGVWPDERPAQGEISLHRDTLNGDIRPNVVIGLARIKEIWQLPAAVKYGGWNDCPSADVHCAFFRKWQAEVGVQILGMSGDVVECLVSNPPTDQAAAIELAWQHYWYCPDIVEQGCKTVSNLAATLIDSDYWYFWWD